MKASTNAINEIKNDPESSEWLLEQIEIIRQRDIYVLLKDMADLKRIALLMDEEARREEEERIEEVTTCPLLTKGWGYPERYTPKDKPVWKVQLSACAGWADLKTSDDGGEYYVEGLTYASALAHVKWMVDDLEHEYVDLRIVRLDTPADCDIY